MARTRSGDRFWRKVDPKATEGREGSLFGGRSKKFSTFKVGGCFHSEGRSRGEFSTEGVCSGGLALSGRQRELDRRQKFGHVGGSTADATLDCGGGTRRRKILRNEIFRRKVCIFGRGDEDFSLTWRRRVAFFGSRRQVTSKTSKKVVFGDAKWGQKIDSGVASRGGAETGRRLDGEMEFEPRQTSGTAKTRRRKTVKDVKNAKKVLPAAKC